MGEREGGRESEREGELERNGEWERVIDIDRQTERQTDRGNIVQFSIEYPNFKTSTDKTRINKNK